MKKKLPKPKARYLQKPTPISQNRRYLYVCMYMYVRTYIRIRTFKCAYKYVCNVRLSWRTLRRTYSCMYVCMYVLLWASRGTLTSLFCLLPPLSWPSGETRQRQNWRGGRPCSRLRMLGLQVLCSLGLLPVHQLPLLRTLSGIVLERGFPPFPCEIMIFLAPSLPTCRSECSRNAARVWALSAKSKHKIWIPKDKENHELK